VSLYNLWVNSWLMGETRVACSTKVSLLVGPMSTQFHVSWNEWEGASAALTPPASTLPQFRRLVNLGCKISNIGRPGLELLNCRTLTHISQPPKDSSPFMASLIMASPAKELDHLLRRLRTITDEIVRSNPTASSIAEYKLHAQRIAEAALHLSRSIPDYQPSKKEEELYQSTQKCSELKSNALRKRLLFIFKDPQVFPFDSAQTKWRKNCVQERCRRIRLMSPGALLCWIKAFRPSIWTVDKMSHRTFDFLLHKISCTTTQPSQSDYEVLRLIGLESPFDSCADYQIFIQGQFRHILEEFN
jgi:hypothetical protein